MGLIGQSLARGVHAWLEVALVPLACAVAFLCGVVIHNAVHTPVFRSRALNGVFNVLLSVAYGHPASGFEPGHNLSHHKHAQTARDVTRTTRAAFRWNLLNVLLIYPLVARAVARGEMRYVRWSLRHRRAWLSRYVREAFVVLVFSAGWAALDWRMFVLYGVLPRLFAAWGIFAINFVQHDGCDASSEWNHSRNFVGPVLNYLAFNNGFHTVHHLAPGLHWSDLPRAHALLVHGRAHPALEQRSLPRWSFSAFVFPGRRTTFDGAPISPPAPIQDEEWLPE